MLPNRLSEVRFILSGFWLCLTLLFGQLTCPIVFLFTMLLGCTPSDRTFYLDSSIPLVVTPLAEIAFVRTKWINGKLQETAFLDKQDRIRENFVYGRTNYKILNQYTDTQLRASTCYYHSDSSPSGYVEITKQWFTYDQTGHLVRVRRHSSHLNSDGRVQANDSSTVLFSYASLYDTLTRHVPPLNHGTSTNVNVNRWERNRQGQLVHNVRLSVLNRPNGIRPDTFSYYSHWFSYDKKGRHTLAWYDLMYLGQFYMPEGPDTIRYFYDQRNRLVRELHRYTTDVRNEREIDTTRLNPYGRNSAAKNRQHFFVGDSIYLNNNRTNTVVYKHEAFNPAKHLPLHTSQDIDY